MCKESDPVTTVATRGGGSTAPSTISWLAVVFLKAEFGLGRNFDSACLRWMWSSSPFAQLTSLTIFSFLSSSGFSVVSGGLK